MQKFLFLLFATLLFPTAVNADHKYPVKDFNDRDNFSLALSIMEVRIARCKIAQGNISAERATKVLTKNISTKLKNMH